MDKKGLLKLLIFIVILLIIILAIIAGLLYFLFKGKNYNRDYSEKFASGELVNPTANLTYEQAVQQFDSNFVLYILYSLKAYNLHSTPFSSDKPRVEFYINDDIYNAVVDKGKISVEKGEIEEEDIIITTTKEEGVKMLQNKDYISESFQSGASKMEMIAGKTELASKGYLEIYTGVTGNSITGFFLKTFINSFLLVYLYIT